MLSTQLQAGDLMKSQVLSIPVESDLEEAQQLLEEARISGAPVVDSRSRVVGVLSLTDLAQAKEEEDAARPRRPRYYMAEPLDEGIDLDADEYENMPSYNPGVLPAGTVSEWMTEDIISVRSDATVREVCGTMAENRIHRVLVVDDGELRGIISTLDVVRYLAENG